MLMRMLLENEAGGGEKAVFFYPDEAITRLQAAALLVRRVAADKGYALAAMYRDRALAGRPSGSGAGAQARRPRPEAEEGPASRGAFFSFPQAFVTKLNTSVPMKASA
jgi:hypothetical protein